MDVHASRRPEHDIEPFFLERWSPRAMSGEPLPRERLLTLFEAARWAPSSYNNQPWRFVYARRDDRAWPEFLALLTEGNRAWARRASALVVVLSKTTFDRNGEPSRTHSFDTGAAWQNLALQGSRDGLVVHGMEGFDYDRARAVVGAPSEYAVEAMVAIGAPGAAADLPPKLQERERPSSRRPLAEIVFEGRWRPGGA